jgi:ABC-type uncharacterized transport system involved in gliding motility auxiliary subunit
LKKSTRDGEVVLVSDSDMLNNHVSIREENVMGHKVEAPMNGNLNFVQSLVEELAGDDNLISSRSRASMDHPFTRVKAMEAQAGKQFQEKIQVLETQQRDMNRKIKALQAGTDGTQNMILSPDQEQELAGYQESMTKLRRELEQVRGNLRKQTEALEFKTKVINIGAVPCLVALAGMGLAIVRTRRRAPRKTTTSPLKNRTLEAGLAGEPGMAK